MNVREAMQLVEYRMEEDYDIAPELREAVILLSAVLDERDVLRGVCETMLQFSISSTFDAKGTYTKRKAEEWNKLRARVHAALPKKAGPSCADGVQISPLPQEGRSMERYCTECNATLQKAIVDGQETVVCMKCSKIEGGYTEEERPLVHELQGYFKDQEWRISGILTVFRRHLRKETREEA